MLSRGLFHSGVLLALAGWWQARRLLLRGGAERVVALLRAQREARFEERSFAGAADDPQLPAGRCDPLPQVGQAVVPRGREGRGVCLQAEAGAVICQPEVDPVAR